VSWSELQSCWKCSTSTLAWSGLTGKALITVRAADRSLADLVSEGDEEALQALPTIAKRLPPLTQEYVGSGGSALNSRLQGEA
jgi:hypothetical protein